VLPEVALGGALGHVTEAVGPGFVLLRFGTLPAWASMEGLRLVPVDAGGQLAQAFDAAAGSAYLLRPDGHVAARWKQPNEAAVRTALRRALGHHDTPAAAAPEAPDSGSARDRLYTQLALGVSTAGSSRETLFLARLALLLCERLDDEAEARKAIAAALHDLPEPSLSAPGATY
jgi:hypothetical protein